MYTIVPMYVHQTFYQLVARRLTLGARMQACEPKCNLPVLIALWGRKVVTFPWTSYGVGSLLPSPQRTGRLHEILLAWLIAKAYCSAVTRALAYFLLLTSEVHREAWTPVLLLLFMRLLQLTQEQVSGLPSQGMDTMGVWEHGIFRTQELEQQNYIICKHKINMLLPTELPRQLDLYVHTTNRRYYNPVVVLLWIC